MVIGLVLYRQYGYLIVIEVADNVSIIVAKSFNERDRDRVKWLLAC